MSDRGQPADNLAVLRAVLDAFNEGRLGDLQRLCDADIRYVIRGRGPLGGEYRGPQAFVEALSRVKELTGGTMTMHPEVLLDGGDAVMMYARITGARSDGRTYDSFQAYLYRFRDGLLIEGQTIPVDQQAFDAFTS